MPDEYKLFRPIHRRKCVRAERYEHSVCEKSAAQETAVIEPPAFETEVDEVPALPEEHVPTHAVPEVSPVKERAPLEAQDADSEEHEFEHEAEPADFGIEAEEVAEGEEEVAENVDATTGAEYGVDEEEEDEAETHENEEQLEQEAMA